MGVGEGVYLVISKCSQGLKGGIYQVQTGIGRSEGDLFERPCKDDREIVGQTGH